MWLLCHTAYNLQCLSGWSVANKLLMLNKAIGSQVTEVLYSNNLRQNIYIDGGTLNINSIRFAIVKIHSINYGPLKYIRIYIAIYPYLESISIIRLYVSTKVVNH